LSEFWKERQNQNVNRQKLQGGKPSKKTVGEEYWTPIAYFSTLQNALDYLVDLEVSETGLVDLRTIVAKQAELYELIRTLGLS